MAACNLSLNPMMILCVIFDVLAVLRLRLFCLRLAVSRHRGILSCVLSFSFSLIWRMYVEVFIRGPCVVLLAVRKKPNRTLLLLLLHMENATRCAHQKMLSGSWHGWAGWKGSIVGRHEDSA